MSLLNSRMCILAMVLAMAVISGCEKERSTTRDDEANAPAANTENRAGDMGYPQQSQPQPRETEPMPPPVEPAPQEKQPPVNQMVPEENTDTMPGPEEGGG